MSSIIVDFFKNHPITSGGGVIDPSTFFSDELEWNYDSTAMQNAGYTQPINQPIILQKEIGTINTSDNDIVFVAASSNSDFTMSPSISIIPAELLSITAQNYLFVQPSTGVPRYISTAYNLSFWSSTTNFNTKNQLHLQSKITKDDLYMANYYNLENLSNKSFPVKYIGLGVSPAYTSVDSITYFKYITYSKSLLDPYHPNFDISQYLDTGKILTVYIYFDPESRLVQVYHDDYLNPNNLLDSVILPEYYVSENGFRICYLPGYHGGNAKITWDGGLIIPDSSFNPNVNYTNTSLVI